jgi:arginase family enzyme
MIDISYFFQPIEIDIIEEQSLVTTIISHTAGNFPVIDKGGIAIFYCPEFRNGVPKFQNQKDERFREEFYNLYPSAHWEKTIYDLGNILPGEKFEDTYFAISHVVEVLVKNDVIPIIIGGSQDLLYAVYRGYQNLEQSVNITTIDSKMDFGATDKEVSFDGFLSPILMHNPSFLFNYSVIGLQAPFVKQSEMDLFEKLYFDTLRLGEYNSDFRKAEPLIRNADILNIDLFAIKASEFNGDLYSSPNGFYAEQVCQIAKYAGISDKLSTFALFNLFPSNTTKTSNELVAQIIWYFIDGVADRKGDFPKCAKTEYIKFMVNHESFENDLVFYKSNKSQRWWMEVPHPKKEHSRYDRHHLIPCNQEDYDFALKNEIPDLWWRTYQKLK